MTFQAFLKNLFLQQSPHATYYTGKYERMAPFDGQKHVFKSDFIYSPPFLDFKLLQFICISGI